MLTPEKTFPQEDPVVRNARREAIVSVLIWFLAMAYTVGYCWLFAYGRDPATMRFYAGIPDWVLWGIIAPWLVCLVVSWWFAYVFMTDEPLGAEAPPAGDDEL